MYRSGLHIVLLSLLSSEIAVAQRMYWSDPQAGHVQRIRLDGSGSQVLVPHLVGDARGLALDLDRGHMYWTDQLYNRIKRANLDGTNIEILIDMDLSRPRGLALDPQDDKMYWTDDLAGTISRANLDGSDVEILVSGLQRPLSIDLDLDYGLIYWADCDAAAIQRANLDGSDVVTLVTAGLQCPRAVRLAASVGKMYWVDWTAGKIQRSNLDGSQVELVRNVNSSSVHDLAIDEAAQRLYWFVGNTLVRSTLIGTDPVKTYLGGAGPASIDLDALNGRLYLGGVGGIQRVSVNGGGLRNLISSLTLNFPGFALAFDPLAEMLYWMDGLENEVRRMPVGGGTIETVVPSVTVSQSGLLVDVAERLLYWANPFSARIRVAELDGSNVQIISEAVDANALGIDPKNGLMYFSTDSNGYLGRVGLDGTNPELMEDLLASLGPIAIDAPSRSLFRISGGNIHRVDLDFLQSTVLIPLANSPPTTVTVDPITQKLYWVQGSSGIRRSNLDGSTIETYQGGFVGSAASLAVYDGRMFWNLKDGGPLQEAHFDQRGVKYSFVAGVGQPNDVALDAPNGKAYWAAPTLIARSNLDGSELQHLVRFSNEARGLALDLVNRKIYWTAKSDGVWRADMDGLNPERLVSSPSPWGIALDPAEDVMYWTEPERHRVHRARLDGFSHKEIIRRNLEAAQSLAVDPVVGKMYWADHEAGRIGRASIDGSQIVDLVRSASGKPYAIALDLVAGKIYWTNTMLNKLQRADLNGTNVQDLVSTTTWGSPGEIALNPLTQKIHWRCGLKLLRANFDGSGPELLGTLPSSSSGYALDHTTGKIYFSLGSEIRWAYYDAPVTSLLISGQSSPKGITLDLASGKIYWNSSGTIRRANLNGTSVEDVLTTTAHSIAVVSGSNRIYWSDVTNDRIQRSELNGSNVLDLITTIHVAARGIAIDQSLDRIFWANPDQGTIQTGDLDGGGIQDVISGFTGLTAITLDPENDRMYWSEQHPSGGRIWQARRDGSELAQFASGLPKPAGLAIDSRVPGDCSLDWFVDSDDWLADCLIGPNGLAPSSCNCIDFDEDRRVDLRDYGALQLALTEE